MSLISMIFRDDMSEYTYPMSKAVFVRLLMLAAASGMVAWLLGVAFDRFMMTPVFCKAATDVAMCANSTAISSYAALILVGMMNVPLLVMIGMKRPLVVAVAAAVTLWGLTQWTNGAWLVSLLITVVASIVVYAAVGWLNRIRGNAGAILMIVLFVVAARFVLMA